MNVYADSSFFVSAYLKDRHARAVDELLSSKLQLWFTPLHFAEWCHAVAQHVFRGEISLAEADRAHEALNHDRISSVWTATEMPDNAFTLCAELARRHGAKLGIRTLGSLHVASALELKAERFWTFDERQARLARAEGLKTA